MFNYICIQCVGEKYVFLIFDVWHVLYYSGSSLYTNRFYDHHPGKMHGLNVMWVSIFDFINMFCSSGNSSSTYWSCPELLR